jgi:hypothetical protein
MTERRRGSALALPEAERRRLAHKLRAAHPELRAGAAPGSLVLELGVARLVLVVESAQADAVHVRGERAALRYVIEGAISTEEATRARAAVLAISESLLALERAVEGPRTIVSEGDLAQLAPGESATLDPLLLRDPSSLVDAVQSLHRASLDGNGPAEIRDLPPCLDLAVRPEPPRAYVAEMLTPLIAPCDACGVAAMCPASAVPRLDTPRPLRALRHAEAGAAALSAMTAVANAFDRPLPEIAVRITNELSLLRAGIHSLPPVPFELSLKRRSDELESVLRFVEYSPRSPHGMPSRTERGPERRRRLIDLAESATASATDCRAWLSEIEAAQSRAVDLSLGFEIDLGTNAIRPQLYAHVEAMPREAARDLAMRTLRFAGVAAESAEPILAMHEIGGEGGSDLVLAAHSPSPASPRRTKLYFERALRSGHRAARLEPLGPLGALEAFAPTRGLAVLVAEQGRVDWEKWDFPCAVHYQGAEGLSTAFAEGLRAADEARVHRLMDGTRFAPWPTWISVGRATRAMYFVPR